MASARQISCVAAGQADYEVCPLDAWLTCHGAGKDIRDGVVHIVKAKTFPIRHTTAHVEWFKDMGMVLFWYAMTIVSNMNDGFVTLMFHIKMDNPRRRDRVETVLLGVSNHLKKSI